MPEEDIARRTLELPKELDAQLHEKMYRQYKGARPSFNAYLVAVLSNWVHRPDPL